MVYFRKKSGTVFKTRLSLKEKTEGLLIHRRRKNAARARLFPFNIVQFRHIARNMKNSVLYEMVKWHIRRIRINKILLHKIQF